LVRANVFVGPVQDAQLELASVRLSLAQCRAQNALDFLHELAVAHVWLCNQVCLLLLQGKGIFAPLATAPDTHKRYDLHLFVGHLNWSHVSHMQLFDMPHVSVNVNHIEYKVRSAARVQCCLVERINTATIFPLMMACVCPAFVLSIVSRLHGLPTVKKPVAHAARLRPPTGSALAPS